MKHTGAILVIAVALLANIRVSEGDCFPADWHGEQWFRSWDEYGLADYWLVDFKTSKYTWKPQGLEYNLDVDFKCRDYTGNDTYMYYTLWQPEFNTKFCAFTAAYTNTLVSRYKTIYYTGMTEDTVVDVNTCESEVSDQPLTVFMAYPFTRMEEVECPFESGSYHLAIVGEDGITYCADDDSSAATVDGDHINMESCYQGISAYAHPVQHNFTCIDVYPDSLLGDDGGTMVLLMDEFTPDQPLFYCARMSEAADGTVTLSLSTANADQTYCPINVNADSTGEGFFQIILTKKPDDETNGNETCNFPSSWTDADRWWTGTSVVVSTSIQMFNTYTSEQLTNSLITGGNTLLTTATDCYIARTTDGNTTHYYIYNNTDDEHHCNEEIVHDHLIFHRGVQRDNVAYPMQTCISTVASETRFHVYLQSPMESFFTGIEFPFPAGNYSATYSESPETAQVCLGDTTSWAAVDGNTLTLNLCDSTNSYEQPYQTTFTAIANWSASEMGGDSNDGDFLLLVTDLPTDDGTTSMWCARYLATDETLYLSLLVTSSTSVYCNTGKDAEFYGILGEDTFKGFVIGTQPTVEVTTESAAEDATTQGSAVDATTQGSAVDATTQGSAVDATTQGSAVDATTQGSAVDATTQGSAVDATTQGSAVDATTQGSDDAEVTTQADDGGNRNDEVTTESLDLTTSGYNESAQHVTITINGSYSELVTPDEDEFLEYASQEILDQTGVTEDMIENLEVSEGSIILDFDIMPGQHNSAGYVPVLTGVANLQDAVDNSRFQIRLPSGILVMPAADALEHWQPPPGGPCSLAPCENGGQCSDRTISMYTCVCPPTHTGAMCQLPQSEASTLANAGTDYMAYLIGLCVLAGVIMIATGLAVFLCGCRTPKRKVPPSWVSGEEGFGYARTWTADYVQFGSNAYGETMPYTDTGHSNGTLHTESSYATTLPQNNSQYLGGSWFQ